MKTTCISLLLLVAVSSCSLSDRKSSLFIQTWTFETSTLTRAIDDICEYREWEQRFSFKVRNDRKFDYLVFKNVIYGVDLLREIKSETHCEMHVAGRSVLIVLPKLE